MVALSSRPLPRLLAIAAGFALLILAAGIVAARPVHAAPTFTVDTLSDGHLDGGATTCLSATAGGHCTLRAALELNDMNGGGAAVTLGPVGTNQFQVTLGQLVILHDVTITGPGPSSVVNGDLKHRVFAIGSRATVAMTGFSIIKGSALDPSDPLRVDGGGIFNFGNLTLSNMTMQANQAGFGGAIDDFGTLTMKSGVVITMNQARQVLADNTLTGGVGGGVQVIGKATSTDDRFTTNQADVAGGNLAVNSTADDALHGSATVLRDLFAQGTAEFGAGAFVNEGDSAAFQFSTFDTNVAQAEEHDSFGGAVESECGSISLVNDTLDRNRADHGVGGGLLVECFVARDQSAGTTSASEAEPFANGRAVPRPSIPTSSGFADTSAVATTASPSPSATPPPRVATATLDFVTMAENLAGVFPTLAITSGGDGITVGPGGTVTVHNTIVAKKTSDPGTNCLAGVPGTGTIKSQGYNLENANDCGFSQTGDQTKVDPQLGALADNGGPTHTMALTAGTPAVDAADPKCDVATDQRAITRPQGPRCDIGAFELQAAAPPTATPLPLPPVTGRGAQDGGWLPRALLILVLLAIPALGAALWNRRRRTA